MKWTDKKPVVAGIFLALIFLVIIGCVVYFCGESMQSCCFLSGEGESEVPLVDFTGATTLVKSHKNGTELNIQSTIENCDLVILDIEKIRKQLFAGDNLSVKIEGKPYLMVLKGFTIKTPREVSGIYSYTGYLDGFPESEIVLTAGEHSVVASIRAFGEEYIVDSASYADKDGNYYQYEYKTGDVRIEGEPLPAVQDYLAHADNSEGLDN